MVFIKREMKTFFFHKKTYTNVQGPFNNNRRKLETTHVHQVNEWINKLWYIYKKETSRYQSNTVDPFNISVRSLAQRTIQLLFLMYELLRQANKSDF